VVDIVEPSLLRGGVQPRFDVWDCNDRMLWRPRGVAPVPPCVRTSVLADGRRGSRRHDREFDRDGNRAIGEQCASDFTDADP
jgi:hypothetical protein